MATTTWIAEPPSEGVPFCGTPDLTERTSFNKEGKSLFQQNCQTCHSLFKTLIGPALVGFEERGPWADRKELYKWIKNPTAYMKKDSYTKALQIQYGAVCMPSPHLTHKEIDAIVNYISAPVY